MNAKKCTKAGVVKALIEMGYSQTEGPFPPALKTVSPAAEWTYEEMEFACYLVGDTDFGGAWNDGEQIEMHCA